MEGETGGFALREGGVAVGVVEHCEVEGCACDVGCEDVVLGTEVAGGGEGEVATVGALVVLASAFMIIYFSHVRKESRRSFGYPKKPFNVSIEVNLDGRVEISAGDHVPCGWRWHVIYGIHVEKVPW